MAIDGTGEREEDAVSGAASRDDGGTAVGEYSWEHFKQEYYYDADGEPPRDSDGEAVPFDPAEYLGFAKEETEWMCSEAHALCSHLDGIVDERTVDVPENLDEDEFFSTPEGAMTVVNR